MCPGSQGGHQHLGLHDQEHGQEIEGRNSLEYSIQISDLQFRNEVSK